MKIHVEKDIYVPSGFYCDGCSFIAKSSHDANRIYCQEFFPRPWLEVARNGKIIKCFDCLLACRKSLVVKPEG